MSVSELADLGDFVSSRLGLPGVDQEQRQLGKVPERTDSWGLGIIDALKDDSLALGGNGVVYARGVAMDAHLGNKSPSVDALDLQAGFLMGLVGMGAGQSSQLEQQRGGHADRNRGAASETGANGNGGAKRVEAAVERGHAEREEKVEKGSGGILMDLANLFGMIERDDIELGLEGVDELRVQFGDE